MIEDRPCVKNYCQFKRVKDFSNNKAGPNVLAGKASRIHPNNTAHTNKENDLIRPHEAALNV